MLRVTSGTAKGKKLKAPDTPEFRAVQDKAKLAIFSMLADKVVGASCLDLYAGSGSLGIEALSRGASHCDFVDYNRKAEQAIEKNLFETGLSDKGEFHRSDAIKFAANAPLTYDIIFVDPFFKETHFRFLFENLEMILKDDGVIFFSHGSDTDTEDAISNTMRLQIHDQRRYGNAFITVITKSPKL